MLCEFIYYWLISNKIAFLVVWCCIYNIIASQADSLSIKNGIDNPGILTTDHFGDFSSRINQNFKLALYFTEDFLINHAPDFQTGLNFVFPYNTTSISFITHALVC